jgi:hypothetical protein
MFLSSMLTLICRVKLVTTGGNIIRMVKTVACVIAYFLLAAIASCLFLISRHRSFDTGLSYLCVTVYRLGDCSYNVLWVYISGLV